MIALHAAYIIHNARDFLYIATGLAFVNGLVQVLPRPWRKKD